MWQWVWDPCTRAVVGFRALAGRQAGAAGVCPSVLPCECTNNARDCYDEAAVLQFSLRSLFWRFVVFESLWHRRLRLTKKDLAEIFFLAFVSVVVLRQTGVPGALNACLFSPSSRSTISSSGQSLLPALRLRRKKTSPYNPIPSGKPPDPENPTSFVALAATTPSLPTLKKTLYLVGICAASISFYHRRRIHTETWGESEQQAERP